MMNCLREARLVTAAMMIGVYAGWSRPKRTMPKQRPLRGPTLMRPLRSRSGKGS